METTAVVERDLRMVCKSVFGIVLDATCILCMAWLFLSTSFGFRSQEVHTSALLVSARSFGSRSFGSRLKKLFGKLAAV